MRFLRMKLILFLLVWYEVASELGFSAGTAFAVSLVVCGAGMTLVQLPAQIVSALGPRLMPFLGPVMVWYGLAAWTMSGFVSRFPGLTVCLGALLALAGAGAHYAVTRYPAWFERRRLMLRGLVVPVTCVLLPLIAQGSRDLLAVPATLLLIAMPLRLGWRFVGPVAAKRFDARMGDAESFAREGYSRET